MRASQPARFCADRKRRFPHAALALRALRPGSALAAALLGGCISLLPEPAPAPRLFALEAARGQGAQEGAIDVVIAVAAPEGARAALGPDLLWRNGDEIAFVAGVKWAGRAEDLLQVLLIETMTRQGRVRAVVRAGEARADYVLRWDIVEFEAVEDAGGFSARFVAHARLIDARTRAVTAARMVSSEAAFSSRSEAGAADALARAAREGGARIAAFAAESAQESAVSISR